MSRSRGYHHGELAEALEAAAMRLLDTKPASDISLREVARAADVSHNAPYHHFSDRRGLLKALAERSMAELVDQVHEAVASAPDAAGALLAGGQAYIAFAGTRSHAFETIFDPAVCIPGQPSERMAPLIEDIELLLARLGEGAGAGTESEVQGLWGLIHGHATLVAAGHLSREEARAAFAAILTRALR